MKKNKKVNILIASILLLTAIITLCVYPKVPDTVPIHWNFNGEVDSTGPKYMLFVFLGIAFGANLLMLFAKKIDPKGENYDKFPLVFDITRVFITALLCGMELMVIGFAFNPSFADMETIMYLIMGMMFILLGNYMPKVKRNYTFGIKTPWTLDNETVWNKTHRMAGVLWVIGGVIILFAAFIPAKMALILMMGVLFLMVIIPTVYSYIAFKKEKENEANTKKTSDQ